VIDGPDAKALVNSPSLTRSKAYTEFVAPIEQGRRGGFDIHIYFLAEDAEETRFAQELHQRIRRECQ
jgi:hypothetical protein